MHSMTSKQEDVKDFEAPLSVVKEVEAHPAVVKDVEAPPTVDGDDATEEVPITDETDILCLRNPRITMDPALLKTTVVYIVLIIICCVGPVIIYRTADIDYNESSPEHEQLVDSLLLIMIVGIIAVIVSIVGAIIAVRRWKRLSTCSKVVGLIPPVCSSLLVMGVVLPMIGI